MKNIYLSICLLTLFFDLSNAYSAPRCYNLFDDNNVKTEITLKTELAEGESKKIENLLTDRFNAFIDIQNSDFEARINLQEKRKFVMKKLAKYRGTLYSLIHIFDGVAPKAYLYADPDFEAGLRELDLFDGILEDIHAVKNEYKDYLNKVKIEHAKSALFTLQKSLLNRIVTKAELDPEVSQSTIINFKYPKKIDPISKEIVYSEKKITLEEIEHLLIRLDIQRKSYFSQTIVYQKRSWYTKALLKFYSENELSISQANLTLIEEIKTNKNAPENNGKFSSYLKLVHIRQAQLVRQLLVIKDSLRLRTNKLDKDRQDLLNKINALLAITELRPPRPATKYWIKKAYLREKQHIQNPEEPIDEVVQNLIDYTHEHDPNDIKVFKIPPPPFIRKVVVNVMSHFVGFFVGRLKYKYLSAAAAPLLTGIPAYNMFGGSEPPTALELRRDTVIEQMMDFNNQVIFYSLENHVAFKTATLELLSKKFELSEQDLDLISRWLGDGEQLLSFPPGQFSRQKKLMDELIFIQITRSLNFDSTQQSRQQFTNAYTNKILNFQQILSGE
jgi:hypothetical protein